MKSFLIAISAGLALVLTGCGGTEPVSNAIPFKPYVIQDSSRVQDLGGGLKLYPISEGPGPQPAQGNRVCLHFYGLLGNGTKFESSWDHGTMLCFVIGGGEVIPGLEKAVRTMRLGSKAVIFVPAELGYGSRGLGKTVPPGSNLIFHVDLQGNF